MVGWLSSCKGELVVVAVAASVAASGSGAANGRACTNGAVSLVGL